MRNFYGYKVQFHAVHSRTLRTMGRGNAVSKRTEPDTALITLYRKAESMDHLRERLVAELPVIRKMAGVSLTPKDIALGFSTKTFQVMRVSH
jgi:hypothetical protein